jgi:hypothetical protein
VAAVSQADPMRMDFAKQPNRTPEMAAFYAESLSYRWDDLASASLTEWSDLLYQTGLLPDPAYVNVAAFPGEEEDERPDEDDDAG